MLFLETFVNIKDGESKVVYVKEDNFVAIASTKGEEIELSSFLYNLVEDLREDLALSEFDELIADKIVQLNLPAGLDLACGYLINSKLYIKTLNQGAVFGRRDREKGKIISGNKSAVGKVKPGDLFIFTFEDFEETKIESIRRESFLQQQFQDKSCFLASFVSRLEREKEGSAFEYIERMPDFSKYKLAVGIALLVFLFGSVYLGYQRKKEAALRERVVTVKKEVETLLAKAEDESLIEPSKARESFQQAQDKVEKLEKSLPESKKSLILDLKQLLEKKKEEIFKETQGKAEEFYDLGLLQEQPKLEDLDYSQGNLFLLLAGEKVFALDISSKSLKQYNTQGLKGIKLIASPGEGLYVFSSQGIFELFEDKEPEKKVDRFDKWEGVVDFSAYGKNFYLLNYNESQVLKHTPIEGGYSPPLDYLKPPLPDLNKEAKMAIDGSIYLASNGNIYKYFQGKKEAFSLKLPAESFSADMIYTDKEIDFLYILDKQAGKVYNVNKQSQELQEQITSRIIIQAQAFFVNSGNVYIVVKDKIYLLR